MPILPRDPVQAVLLILALYFTIWQFYALAQGLVLLRRKPYLAVRVQPGPGLVAVILFIAAAVIR